jgi:RNA polymerase sigma-70 factor (ECF subfamily)
VSEEAAENARLVRCIAAGAEGASAAEAELCRRFAPRAHLYGRRHLRDDDRARELAQAVMLAVLEAVRAGRVQDPERLDRFVLGTCRNVVLRARELEGRMRVTDTAELDTMASVPPSEPLDLTALYQCLAALEARERKVVYLSFTEERSAEEISVALQTSPGNIRVLRHRAVMRLRRCMDERTEATR